MSKTEVEPRPKEETHIIVCEGCSSRWRLKFDLTNKLAADLVACPLCTEAEKNE